MSEFFRTAGDRGVVICICSGSVLTEIISYCNVHEPFRMLTVEGDSVTSKEGLDLVCVLTKPCSWFGSLLLSLKFLMGGSNGI